MNTNDLFKGKHIVLMGLGLLGRQVGLARYALECGAQLTITDLKTAEELASSIEKLKQYEDRITYHLGGHNKEDFQSADMILRANNVPLNSPYLEEAEKHNIPIEMDASLFARLIPDGVTLVGVTGTRGKSTVTHAIHHVLSLAGKRVFLAGNIRDIATLPLIDEVQRGDIVVLELDSWQLQGLGAHKISPHIAVFTNFMPDHLNYYPDMQSYFNDKAYIFANQNDEDTLVLGSDMRNTLETYWKKGIPSGTVVDVNLESIENFEIQIPGTHNRENLACVVEATRALGVSENDIKKGVETFRGVEGRLQFVREVEGVKIYNDNNASTPDATIAGLKALGKDSNIILIMGGADKELDASRLIETLPKYCKGVVLLSGTGTAKIRDKVHRLANVTVSEADDLKTCIEQAFEKASEQDVILFSPAFASFGHFANEYERNDQFLSIVENL